MGALLGPKLRRSNELRAPSGDGVRRVPNCCMVMRSGGGTTPARRTRRWSRLRWMPPCRTLRGRAEKVAIHGVVDYRYVDVLYEPIYVEGILH